MVDTKSCNYSNSGRLSECEYSGVVFEHPSPALYLSGISPHFYHPWTSGDSPLVQFMEGSDLFTFPHVFDRPRDSLPVETRQFTEQFTIYTLRQPQDSSSPALTAKRVQEEKWTGFFT